MPILRHHHHKSDHKLKMNTMRKRKMMRKVNKKVKGKEVKMRQAKVMKKKHKMKVWMRATSTLPVQVSFVFIFGTMFILSIGEGL